MIEYEKVRIPRDSQISQTLNLLDLFPSHSALQVQPYKVELQPTDPRHQARLGTLTTVAFIASVSTHCSRAKFARGYKCILFTQNSNLVDRQVDFTSVWTTPARLRFIVKAATLVRGINLARLLLHAPDAGKVFFFF
ncbi:hypothetical protein RRG08_041756 [Elysia crispata]|uniref:Uncharacterized protein n=1 Tax=Elysia crispata TaxID=231223 RepID=A0AAE0YZ93_9GAST|nr:hypothetical protein RRG08_041756 [Elysia crispata]